MSECKAGEHVEAKDYRDKWRPAVVIYTDGSDCPYHVLFEDEGREVEWKVASNVRKRTGGVQPLKSNGSVTQRLRRELDVKNEENEKLQDQIQRLCKQVDDMVKAREATQQEHDAQASDAYREIEMLKDRIRVLEGLNNNMAKTCLNGVERIASNDTRVLDCIQTLLGMRGER
jgi:predicted RNase H-like nuclease (RuvC/YqgF family)